MAEVRSRISLRELNIEGGLTTRTAATGALILEVPGANSGQRADALASKMREVLHGREGIRVDRPKKMAEVRVRGLEWSIIPSEVATAIAEKGGCSPSDVQTGSIRRAPRGQGSLWLKMPLAAAKKASVDGHHEVDWSRVRIDLLDTRPLRCFRCLERGHTRSTCAETDRLGRCYRCGETGHISGECSRPPSCPLCTDLGRPAGHIWGGGLRTNEKKRENWWCAGGEKTPTATHTQIADKKGGKGGTFSVLVAPLSNEKHGGGGSHIRSEPIPPPVTEMEIDPTSPLPQRPKRVPVRREKGGGKKSPMENTPPGEITEVTMEEGNDSD